MMTSFVPDEISLSCSGVGYPRKPESNRLLRSRRRGHGQVACISTGRFFVNVLSPGASTGGVPFTV
jgi:hypothetical protein